jgi:hypothetical protein
LKTVLNNYLVALLRPARHPRVRLNQLLLYIRAQVPVVSSCQVRETKFFCILLFEGTFTSFFKDKKSLKKSQNSRNQGFLSIFA